VLCDSTRVVVSDLGGASSARLSLELPLGAVAVATGLVASLAQRGGNLTGASIMVVELMASR